MKGLTNMAASARETTGQPWRLSPLRMTRPTVTEAQAVVWRTDTIPSLDSMLILSCRSYSVASLQQGW